MNIFEKRPLALVLCIGLCGFFLFTFENLIFRLLLILVAFLPTIFSHFINFKDESKLLSKVATLSLIISFLLSYLYFDRWFKAYDIYDEEVSIVGTVEELSATNSYTARLLVKVEKVNNEKVRGYKFYAYSNKSDAKGIIAGTRVSFNASLTGFSDESKSYNFSRGINAYANNLKDLTILEYTDGGISEKLSYIKEIMTRYTIMISDKDTGAMVSALLFGEREYLPDQLRLDFKRIGISHILALSGLHLAILSIGLEKVLSLLMLNKKIRLGITSLFILLYMSLTGFSVSVVRAGIMVILYSLLFLMSRSKDSLTSLSVAVFIICLIKPYAIFDISLQLSALSTFGIIAFAEYNYYEKPTKERGRFFKYLYNGILASVFAISTTLWISTSSFGGFSIIAPFTTLIFSFIVELVMDLGCIMLLIGWLVPIGKVVAPLCTLISNLSAWLSSIKWAYVSSAFSIVGFLIILYTVCFFAFLLIKVKKKQQLINVMLIFFCIILIIPTALVTWQNKKDTVAYRADYKSDELIIRSRQEVCIINSAQYSKSLAYVTLNFLDDLKITYLDKYYLTHYSWSIDEDLDILLSNILVEKIYLPSPKNEDEETILKIIYKKVESYRTEIVLFEGNDTVYIGDFSINLIYSAPYGETSVNAFYASNGQENYTYISSGMLVQEKYPLVEEIISETDYLILGEHGKKYKDEIIISKYYDSINTLIIHSDNVFVSDEQALNYENGGCAIFSHPQDIVYFIK